MASVSFRKCGRWTQFAATKKLPAIITRCCKCASKEINHMHVPYKTLTVGVVPVLIPIVVNSHAAAI